MKICSSLQIELQNLTKKLRKLCKTSYENLQLQNPADKLGKFHIYKYESCRQSKALLCL